MAKELECVIKTGSYTFHQGEADEAGRNKAQMMLEYEPASSSQLQEGAKLPQIKPQVESSGRCKEIWNQEQIEDFVRKLGFVDRDKEETGEDKIKSFLHLNQVNNSCHPCTLSPFLSIVQTVHKLFELYLKLRELGHPSYLLKGDIPPISCSIVKETADKMVQQTQQAVTEWTEEVTELRNRYPWLLYFSIPRMLQLYKLILPTSVSRKETEKKIVHEVSFLATSNRTERKKLRNGVQVCHNGHE